MSQRPSVIMSRDSKNNYADPIILWETDPENAAALMRAEIENSSDKAKEYLKYILHLERIERMRHGLSPYHAVDLNDLGVKYCHSDLKIFYDESLKALKADSRTAAHWGYVAHSSFLMNDLAATEQCFRVIAKNLPHLPYRSTIFDPAFHRSLKLDLTPLPPVHLLSSPAFVGNDVIFICCDWKYYLLYARPLIKSLFAVSPGIQIHCHVVLPDASLLGDLKTSALDTKLSFEIAPVFQKKAQAAGYYHASRLVRLYQFLEQQTLWLIDADAVAVNAPDDLFKKMKGFDLGLWASPARLEPWTRFRACLVAAAPNAKAFLGHVAAYVMAIHKTGFIPWGTDQAALYTSFLYRPISLTMFGPQHGDNKKYASDSVFWFTAGAAKHKDGGQTGRYWDRVALFR